VILVDDGMATGSTMKAFVEAALRLGAEHVVVAAPVAPAATCSEMKKVADDVVCLHAPEIFHAVGDWYEDFSQLSDGAVRELLTEAHSLVC
jgi:putative phosphoribosyl transferase